MTSPISEDLNTFLSDEYPLHNAAREGRVDIISTLLNHGFQVNVFNYDQVTPLHEACFYGHVDCAACLVENNACVNAMNIDGSTPLCEASAMGHVDCVKFLLMHDADVNPPLARCTPLHEAVIRGQADCAQMLVNAGAKLEVSDCHFGTPLHAACFRNSIPCVKVLLEAGASVNATKTHRSALHIAASHGYEALALMLLDFGANVYMENNQGMRPLQIATSDSSLAQELHYHEVNPRTLLQLSKLRIRQLLGANRLHYIDKLHLPSMLQNYLKGV